MPDARNGPTARNTRNRPTMKDVAALADVSLKTVSRVVNGEAGVAAEMAERVQRALDQLDYRHDFAASALRRTDRRSATFGMVLEDLANPFSAAVQRAVEDVARERGVLVLAGSSDDDGERERTLVTTFTNRRVDGLIIMPAGTDHSYLLNERRAGTPIVCVDRPPHFLDTDVVLVDNVEGARAAVHHLVEHGHHRIAFLGDRLAISTARLRLQGYREELAARGLSADEALVHSDVRGSDAAAELVGGMLDRDEPPTAIFAAQNLLAIGAIHALRARGLQHEVALISFDDFVLADLLEPAVTVVAQDLPAIGRVAAETLFARLDGDSSPSRRHVIPTRLVPRGSGELPGANRP